MVNEVAAPGIDMEIENTLHTMEGICSSCKKPVEISFKSARLTNMQGRAIE